MEKGQYYNLIWILIQLAYGKRLLSKVLKAEKEIQAKIESEKNGALKHF